MSGKFVALSKTLLSFSLPRTGLRGLLYHAIAKLSYWLLHLVNRLPGICKRGFSGNMIHGVQVCFLEAIVKGRGISTGVRSL
jgi:hypothetical protein